MDPKKKKKQNKVNANTATTTTATTNTGTLKTNSNNNAATKVSDVVTIDAKKVGIIIGPKGATLQAIQAATNCKLDVHAPAKDDKPNPRSTKQPQATIVITNEGGGGGGDIAKAKQAILELANRGYATILQADTFGEQSLTVHPKYLAEIVGPNGKTIQAIQSSLQVKITIPKTDWKPNTPQIGHQLPSCKVGIAGDDKTNVKQAKQVLQYLLQWHHHDITHPGFIHQEVYVPQEFFHCIIGPRGSEIKHIRGNFKVDVYMPQQPSSSSSTTDNVIVVGLPSNVEKAIKYIHVLMDRDTEQRAQKYNDELYG
jgi:predicted PilT family ATPase